MCIIIVKPKGATLPSPTILSHCFNRNPDGTGVMYFDPKRGLILRKGIMNKDEFLDVCERLRERFPNSPVIIHCRWATDGGVQSGLCHPFPIDNRKQVLLACAPSNVKIAVAHNGVIPRWSGLGGDVSDTYLFVKNDLFPAFEANPDYLSAPENRRYLAEISQSRLAFMTATGQAWGIGKFYNYGGVYYSKPLSFFA